MESHQRLGFQRNARHESRLSPTKDSINKITWKRIFVKLRGKVTLEIEGISGNSFFVLCKYLLYAQDFKKFVHETISQN